MSIATRLLGSVLLLGLQVATAEPPKTLPVGPGGRLFKGPDVNSLLARPYRADVPMACTGENLWAGHPAGWAFPDSSVHWYLLTRHGLGFDLQLAMQGQAIAPQNSTAYPSHVSASGGETVVVEGAKWITRDDVLVSKMTLTNTSAAPVEILASLSLPTDAPTAEGGHVSWTLNHAGIDLQAWGRFDGFELVPKSDAAEFYTIEGEKGATTTNSTEPDRKASASGGAVLGNNFGGRPGDNASWTFDITNPIPDAAVTIRYARAMSGNADVAVQLAGQNRMQRRMFPSTGGWGDAESDFSTQTFRMGPLAAGPARIQLFVLATHNNINIDAVYVHDAKITIAGGSAAKTGLSRTIMIEPGKKVAMLLRLAIAPKVEAAKAALDRVLAAKDPLAAHVDEYAAWNTTNVPAFTSMDPAFTKQYWHRATSILRKNLFRAGEGKLAEWGISEGRWTSDWYANQISYGGGHQIREARWLRDPQYVRGMISTWCANEKSNGVFPNYIRPTEIGEGQYTDWITSTVWDAHCVHPNAAKLTEWADALKRNVDGWLATYDADNDGLLLVDSHWWTGMEWQPSFFFFNGYDKDKQDQQLERVDLTAYVYGNAKNLARVLAAAGDDAGAAKYDGIAARIKDATTKTMWDGTSEFFYSVEPKSGEKALVKEVIGVYPFYFSMFDAADGKAYATAWKSILDPAEFWTAWPVASVSKKCPAYSQDITFNGKDVGGCMWNGPTWPHANSLVLSAMAATLREIPDSPLTVDNLYALFQSFTKAQFKSQDLQYPWTGEYYNGDTAQWRTEQRDYNHSTYIDVLIADIAGLRPGAGDSIVVHPLISGQMAPFMIDGVRYHDRDVSILWSPQASDETQPDGLKGFRVYVDGKLAHHNPDKAERVELTAP